MSDAAVEFKPNLEKLRKLQQSASSVVIGGKVNTQFFFQIYKVFLSEADTKMQKSVRIYAILSVFYSPKWRIYDFLRNQHL